MGWVRHLMESKLQSQDLTRFFTLASITALTLDQANAGKVAEKYGDPPVRFLGKAQ
jgi:hypothetical protein